uniref:U-box domain-containing protein n=1 Tax=Pelagomonas calceolata TaxID=35677 RepID=A0A7S3ZVD7_9STRA
MAEPTQKRSRDADADATEDASHREKKMRESINGAAAELLCPITLKLPIQPVMAEDGKIYEEKAIRDWFAKKREREELPTSPSTGAVIGTKLLPAVQVRNTIESLIQTGAIEGELAEAWQKDSAKKLAEETWVKEMRAKAEGGDGDAMYWLGLAYDTGSKGLAEDEAQARAWYERSAAARDPRGLATFGCFLLDGIGGPQDNVFGIMNLAQAAELGSDYGAYILGHAFFSGDGLPKDPVRARYWLKKAVDGECEFKLLFHDDRSAAEQMLEALESGGGVIS